jgi:hypothetical protein
MTGIRDQLREQTVDTVLGTLRVQVGGTGAPIMFWPSLLMTGDMWHGVANDLVTHSQVVLVDPPGHGGSQPLTGMFTFGECARSVGDILDALGHDRAHFVGNSCVGETATVRPGSGGSLNGLRVGAGEPCSLDGVYCGPSPPALCQCWRVAHVAQLAQRHAPRLVAAEGISRLNGPASC